MPYELLEDEIIPQQKTQPQSSLLGSLGRIVGGGALQAASIIEPLLDPYTAIQQGAAKVAETLFPSTQKLPIRPTFSETIKQFPQAQALQPQSRVERFAQNVLGQLPLAPLASNSIPLALARTVGGELGSSLVEESGGGPIAQLAGGLVGGALSGKAVDSIRKQLSRNAFKTSYEAIRKGIVDPTTLNSLATVAQQEAYDTERKLGHAINAKAPKYQRGLEKIYDQVKQDKALTKTDKNDLISKISLMEKEIQMGKVNASQLVDNKKQINDAWAQAFGEENKTYRHHLDELRNLIVETGENIGKDHPEWLKSWKADDNITKAMNFKFDLLGLGEQFPSIGKFIQKPIVKGLLGLGGTVGGYLGSPTTFALGVGTSLGASKAQQLAGFTGYPETQRLLADAFKYTIYRNIPQLTRTLSKLNNEVSQIESNGRYELLD